MLDELTHDFDRGLTDGADRFVVAGLALADSDRLAGPASIRASRSRSSFSGWLTRLLTGCIFMSDAANGFNNPRS